MISGEAVRQLTVYGLSVAGGQEGQCLCVPVMLWRDVRDADARCLLHLTCYCCLNLCTIVFTVQLRLD